MDRVYIIESPSRQDLIEERKEGKALYESLILADCDVNYKLVANKEEFILSLKFIIEDFFEKKGKWHTMPFIHISAHGDEDGIQLTNGELVNWQDFEIELAKINQKIGFLFGLNEYSDFVSRIVLCFSACKGFNGYKIWNSNQPCPYQCIIGPVVDVDWSDSLTAFITFYHLANFKERSFSEAVKQMNLSAGVEDDFRLYVSPEVGRKK